MTTTMIDDLYSKRIHTTLRNIPSPRQDLTFAQLKIENSTMEKVTFSCSSMPRNRELMRVFKDVGLVEQLGSGMSRILKVYDKNIFKISEHFIKVEFPFSVPKDIAIDDNNKEHGSDNIGNTQDNIQVKILKFCEKPRSKKEIAAYMGYKDTKSFAKRYLIPLYNNGKIQMTIPEHPTSKNQKYVTVK